MIRRGFATRGESHATRFTLCVQAQAVYTVAVLYTLHAAHQIRGSIHNITGIGV